MKDSQIKAKITQIVMGAIKSTLKDHPEYLDGKLIKKSATISIAKRSAGHILRLLRMHSVPEEVQEPNKTDYRGVYGTVDPAKDSDDPFSQADGMPPMQELPMCTGKLLPLKELELHGSLFDDSYEGREFTHDLKPTLGPENLAQHKTRELIESTRDLKDKAEEHFVDRMVEDMKTDVPEELERRRTLNNKPRC